MALPPQPNMPPPPPGQAPGGAPVPGGGAPPDMPPELVALCERIATATGIPPALVAEYLAFLVQTQGEQAALAFISAPAEQQHAELMQFQAQQQGGPGGPPPG